MKKESYEKLIVWQKSMNLVVEVYKITSNFPGSELYGLTSQLKRASVSIPSNIAEGSRRGSKKDFRNFLINAYSSGAEIETQLQIAFRLKYINNYQLMKINIQLLEIMKMLNTFIRKLNEK